jgi:hypothetical protein
MIGGLGEVYEGHFVSDKYSGEGTITYPGLVYKKALPLTLLFLPVVSRLFS